PSAPRPPRLPAESRRVRRPLPEPVGPARRSGADDANLFRLPSQSPERNLQEPDLGPDPSIGILSRVGALQNLDKGRAAAPLLADEAFGRKHRIENRFLGGFRDRAEEEVETLLSQLCCRHDDPFLVMMKMTAGREADRDVAAAVRSEERRVGKECRSGGRAEP